MTHAAERQMPDWTWEAEYWLSPAANWLWFAPSVGRSNALVIGDITPSYLRGLSTHFDRVEKLPVASLHRAVAPPDSKASAGTLLYDNGSMDCVVSTNLVNAWPESGHSPFQDHRFVAALTELCRVLRPGGVLFLSGPNARWHRALRWRAAQWGRFVQSDRSGGSLRLGAARQALARAGYSETRAYFVEPSVGDVANVIPACRRAAMAYERERLPRTSVPLRTLWAAGGLYELLYPDAFVLAIK
jgi:SAM-dependent methyltransferase